MEEESQKFDFPTFQAMTKYIDKMIGFSNVVTIHQEDTFEIDRAAKLYSKHRNLEMRHDLERMRSMETFVHASQDPIISGRIKINHQNKPVPKFEFTPSLSFYDWENEVRLMLENNQEISDDNTEEVYSERKKSSVLRNQILDSIDASPLLLAHQNISKDIAPQFCLDPDNIYVDQYGRMEDASYSHLIPNIDIPTLKDLGLSTQTWLQSKAISEALREPLASINEEHLPPQNPHLQVPNPSHFPPTNQSQNQNQSQADEVYKTTMEKREEIEKNRKARIEAIHGKLRIIEQTGAKKPPASFFGL